LKSVDVVIPVFNNSESLPIVVEEVTSYARPDLQIRIILVDDGSKDNSWQVIEVLSGLSEFNLIGIKLAKNFGQLSAMKAGYSLSDADAVISISADLQDPSELVREMISKWENGRPFVVCARKNRQDKFLIKVTSSIAYRILGLEVPGIPKGGFDTFLMSREIHQQLLTLKGRFNFLQADLLSFGFLPEVIEYERVTRKFGKSGYNFRKRYRNFIDGLVDSSYLIIRLATRIGLTVALMGAILAIYLVFSKLHGQAPFNGFTLIASSVLIVGGVQITLTGILGSYIWRIYDAIRERPAFTIEKVIESNGNIL
jgi:dolichol-phosphate mannosyltransferase